MNFPVTRDMKFRKHKGGKDIYYHTKISTIQTKCKKDCSKLSYLLAGVRITGVALIRVAHFTGLGYFWTFYYLQKYTVLALWTILVNFFAPIWKLHNSKTLCLPYKSLWSKLWRNDPEENPHKLKVFTKQTIKKYRKKSFLSDS